MSEKFEAGSLINFLNGKETSVLSVLGRKKRYISDLNAKEAEIIGSILLQPDKARQAVEAAGIKVMPDKKVPAEKEFRVTKSGLLAVTFEEGDKPRGVFKVSGLEGDAVYKGRVVDHVITKEIAIAMTNGPEMGIILTESIASDPKTFTPKLPFGLTTEPVDIEKELGVEFGGRQIYDKTRDFLGDLVKANGMELLDFRMRFNPDGTLRVVCTPKPS